MFSLQRLQLDMVLNSLQEQSHVASLLGYSCPGELTAQGPPAAPSPDHPDRPPSSSSSTEAHDHLHLAEVLLKTLLLSIGFYTVTLNGRVCVCVCVCACVPFCALYGRVHQVTNISIVY